MTTKLAEEFDRRYPDAASMVSVPGASHAHFMQYAQERLLQMARTGEPYEGPPVPRLRLPRTPTLPPPAGPMGAVVTKAAAPAPSRSEELPRQRSLF